MRSVYWAKALTLLLASVVSACAGLRNPGTGPLENGRTVVWTATRCPSVPAGGDEAIFAILGELLLGTLIQTGLNVAKSALDGAAQADREGTVVSGVYPRYSHIVTTQNSQKVAQPALCLVVAYGEDLHPSAWCNHADVKAALVSNAADHPLRPFRIPCNQNRALLEGLETDSLFVGDDFTTDDTAQLPFFYAEIQLDASADAKAVRPRVVNMYYPQPLNPRRRGDTRDLVFTAKLQTLGEKEPNLVVVSLRDLVPGAANDHIATEYGLWANLPAYNGPLDAIDAGKRVGPVNISFELRETGDINVFLQAFAKAFADDQKAYADALDSALLPSAAAKASVAEMKGEAAVAEKHAAAEKAWLDLLTACEKEVGSGQNLYSSQSIKDADVLRLTIGVEAARITANATARENDADEPYGTTTVACPAG